MTQTRRVLILGGGNSGVSAARKLVKLARPEEDFEVALVSHENVRIIQALMSQIVSSLVQPQHAAVPLRESLPGSVTVYTQEVEAVDLQNRQVTLGRGDERLGTTLSYDYLVLALGSVTDVSRVPGLVEHGLQTKTMGDVLQLRNHIIDMLEAASVEQDPEERRRMLTFVVVGAGYAGVEICSQANQLVRESLQFYSSIHESDIRFVILNDSMRILAALSDELAERAARQMQQSGIELKLGVKLESATGNVARLSNGEVIPTRSIIATVGIGTNPVIAGLGLALNRGRVVCDEFCRVRDAPGVYAIGDAAAIPNPKTGQPFPATLPHAITEGHRAAENVVAEMRGEPLQPYYYDTIGQLTFLTKGYALAEVKGMRLHGWSVAVLGRLIFPALLPNWRRRFTLVMDWIIAAVFPRDMTQLRISRSDAVVPMRFNGGEAIIRQGEPGSRLYVITEGEVEVVRRLEDGREEKLAQLGPGKYFGEMALMQDQKRMATVRALNDTKVLSLARHDFSALVQHLPELHDVFERTARERAAASGLDTSPHE